MIITTIIVIIIEAIYKAQDRLSATVKCRTILQDFVKMLENFVILLTDKRTL